jgi:mannose-1-phosphate guanylyltransferase
MQGLILAGGLGTRLRPLTLNTPKPVVSLVNRPLLSYQLELLKRAGIGDVILSLNYQPTRIQEIIGDGSQYGVNIRYVVEPEALGTAGAIKFAEKFIKETIVILNGDNLINLNIAETIKFHREKRALATIVLETLANPLGYGLVEIDEEKRIKNFLEKPAVEDLEKITTRTVNAGTYVLEPEVLDLIPANTNYSFEYGVFPELLRRNERFFAFVTDTYWLDVGTPPRYLRAHQDLINGKVAGFDIADDRGQSEIALTAEISDNSFIGDKCTIENLAKINNSVLEDNVSIAEDAIIENSVIGVGTRIGVGAHISGAIIGQNCRIGSFAAVNGEKILGDGSVLTDYSKV